MRKNISYIALPFLLISVALSAQQTYTPPQPSDGNYILSRSYQTEKNNSSEIFLNSDVIETIQYFDGLGREQQTIGIGQSPLGADMVTPFQYDQYGRMVREWLPFPAASDGVRGNFQAGSQLDAQQFYQNKYANDFQGLATIAVNPYSEKALEPSPLSRVKKQGAPGKDWGIDGDDDSDHTIGFVYGNNTHDSENVNDSSNDNVRLFTVNLPTGDSESPSFSNDGYYEAKVLSKIITKDENHESGLDHTAEEFTDKNGRVVLKRTYNNSEHHDTYYVYDDFGNLTFVIPPLVDTANTISQTVLNNLCYQYIYDYRNRLVEKKIPGKEWEYIVYNNINQPVMTQDANQRASNKWLFTKYDVYGRVAYTGKATISGDRPSIQQTVTELADSYTLWTARTTTANAIGAVDTKAINYNDKGWPNASDITELLTVNYYDDYNIASADLGGAPTTATVFGEATDARTKGLPSISLVRVLTTDDWISTVTLYDDKARPMYTHSNNPYLGTVDVVASQLDFIGRPQKVKSSHTRNGNTIVTLDNFTYDHVGRLLNQTQCIGDQTLGDSCEEGTGNNGVEADPIIVNGGNYTSNLTATNSITIRSTTTISGTVTLNIDPSATGGNGAAASEELIVFNTYDELGQLENKIVGGDADGDGLQTVNYNYNVRGWLQAINDNAPSDNALTLNSDDLWGFKIKYNDITDPTKQLFNGNISETLWDSKSVNPGVPGNLVSERYTYTYDPLNRITSATDNTGNYSLENVSYDKMGNITALKRKGHTNVNATSFGVMDDLTYAYDSGNKLQSVTDMATGTGFLDGSPTGTDYTYDQNGNQKSDANKGITNMEYNFLNLPTKVEVSGSNGGTIDYVYSADGMKLKKELSTGTITEYASGYVYKDNQLQFFPQSEGYVSMENANYKYIYNYLDHLGNVSLSYTDADGNGSINPANEIVEENNFYPFGMKQKGYNGNVSSLGNSTANKFKYNGIELEEAFGLNLYEMEVRQYDPIIGRWTTMDPITHHSISPYAAFDNNPVFWADPSGANSVQDLIDEAWNTAGNGSTTFTSNGDGTFSGGGVSIGKKQEQEDNSTQESGCENCPAKIDLNASTEDILFSMNQWTQFIQNNPDTKVYLRDMVVPSIKKDDSWVTFFRELLGNPKYSNEITRDYMDTSFLLGYQTFYYNSNDKRKYIFRLNKQDHQNAKGDPNRYDIYFFARKECGNCADLPLLYMHFTDKIVRDKVFKYLQTEIEPEPQPLIDGQGSIPLNIKAIEN
jgi:RHS repeat-associated protein